MLPKYEKNQLAPYLEEYNLVPRTTTGSQPFWYGYPVNYSMGNNYAGMSMAPATDGTTAESAADTSAGDIAADAGMGDSGGESA